MKKIFSRDNLLILLVIGLIIHNFFLQTKVEKAIITTRVAAQEANQAAINAGEAASFASDAANYSREAADYASEASENAENAWYSSQNAANNAFGNQCWNCP